jgi:hypothetical protein
MSDSAVWLPAASFCFYKRVLRQQMVGERWPPAYGDMSPEVEKRPLLVDVTKQRREGSY